MTQHTVVPELMQLDTRLSFQYTLHHSRRDFEGRARGGSRDPREPLDGADCGVWRLEDAADSDEHESHPNPALHFELAVRSWRAAGADVEPACPSKPKFLGSKRISQSAPMH